MVFWSFLKKSAAGLFFNGIELKPLIDKGIEYGKGKLTKKVPNKTPFCCFSKQEVL